MTTFARPRVPYIAASTPRARRRFFSTSTVLRTTLGRTSNFNSGFTSSYDPSDDGGRGPMFSKSSVGVPQFYPRDLKKRVDEYVVGQDRAKKTITSVVFNHYQNLRRRQYQEEQERKREEKLMRQAVARDRNVRERDPHPVEGGYAPESPSREPGADSHRGDNYPGQYDFTERMRQAWQQPEQSTVEFYTPEDIDHQPPVKIDKSNILLIGPTGVGKTYILEYAAAHPSSSYSAMTPSLNSCRTLSQKLSIPFTICDCNSFTQAG